MQPELLPKFPPKLSSSDVKVVVMSILPESPALAIHLLAVSELVLVISADIILANAD